MEKYILDSASLIAIIGITLVVAFVVNRFFKRLIRKSSEQLNNDPTNYQFFRHLISAGIYLVGFAIAIYSVPSLRTLANSMLAGAGILAVAMGFASQHALSNIISGMFIVMFKPFRIHDRLMVRTYVGIVEDITLRHTVIRDFENRRIVIPNALISEEIIINADYIEDKICKWIEVGISYDSNIDLAKKILEEEVLEHPLHIDGRNPEQLENNDPIVPVRVLSLGESSVNLRAWAWANNSNDAFIMSCDLYESIKKRFDQEGIVIPFPQRTISLQPNSAISISKVN